MQKHGQGQNRLGHPKGFETGVDMKEIIAYCGLSCQECDAFLAKNRDTDKSSEVADRWSKILNIALRPEDIYCDGCKADSGIRFRYCASCAIRRCAKERLVPTCADCGEYVCRKLEEFFQMVPTSWQRLEDLRSRSQ